MAHSTKIILYQSARFFFFFATPQHMVFPGQGSDQSHSFDLSHSCGNARSPTHCASLGSNLHPSVPLLLRCSLSCCTTVGTPARFLDIVSFFSVCLLFWFFLALTAASGRSSWARDRTQTTAVTQVEAVKMPDP